MIDDDDLEEIFEMPRERHYVLGHEAFRQFCEYDPHQFFEVMSLDNKDKFIAKLIEQVKENYPDDPTELDPQQVKVTPSRIGNRPFIVIEMPPANVCAECVYVGIVSMMDIRNPQDYPNPEIQYFTLELAEDNTRMFCQWKDDTHFNLGEMEGSTSISDFAMVIDQRLEDE